MSISTIVLIIVSVLTLLNTLNLFYNNKINKLMGSTWIEALKVFEKIKKDSEEQVEINRRLLSINSTLASKITNLELRIKGRFNEN